ncbi:phosphatase PAP2 family protein [Nocardia sp. NPDC051570]|uniref:phosphatase PAP2 family protein n=1 Tax=Nocardia sp. NPDC051570 TaxID=3364324 RepID=UPI003787D101
MTATAPESADSPHLRVVPDPASPAPAEVKIINAVQGTIGRNPQVIKAARGMSHFGEHALGWMGIGALGALVDKPRRRQWAGVAVGAFGAHAASVVIKRVVRRPRPNDPSVQVNVSTPSKLSFPSSHATSTTAAAVLLGRLTGLPLPAVLVPPMLLSRVVLGVHYPSDVLAGSALGAASAAAVLAAEKRFTSDRTGKNPR